jgi:ubiquinol-cytochrome c reductase iron-sulfur subunit
MMTKALVEAHPPVDERRRDFLHVATGSFAAVGAAADIWPMINQMNPSVEPGQAIVATWRGRPVSCAT